MARKKTGSATRRAKKKAATATRGGTPPVGRGAGKAGKKDTPAADRFAPPTRKTKPPAQTNQPLERDVKRRTGQFMRAGDAPLMKK